MYKTGTEYPTIFEVLSDLRKYKINPNRFDKLWHKHRWELGKTVSSFDGVDIPPKQLNATTMKIIDEVLEILECQSGDATTADNTIFKVGDEATYENVQFSDQHDPYMYSVDAVMDPTRSLQDANDASLANFFSRPIKIAEEEWSTSANLNFDIDPWSLYFDNPRVSNRLTNFSLMKANLKVKVVINGNGFQYGRMLVSYLPFDVYDNLSTNAALVRSDLVQASQQPHIFLNPTTSTGGEMKLPMFNYQNYFEIIESQWSEMGRLYFRTLNPLNHANGATDVVTITVFAWAEDVSMSVLTSVDQDTLSPQSGEIEEANKEGMISGPATSVAKFAAYLKGVPYIAPFATATEIGAGAVATMAKIFGYCRPPITKAPEPYRPTPVSSLALTNVPDNAQKLTVDEKQELSIDPRIAGVGPADPLNIREIAKRESYLTTFNWNIGTAPDTLLWNARLDPCTWAEDSGPPVSYHFPACCMAALPFSHWKGSMKFRFQIVCSSFHKGRLKIVYDPNFIANNTYLGFSEYNTNYLKVVDIAEEQDFTIEIGNGQERNFLNHALPGQDGVTTMYSTTRYTSKGTGNGVIGVLVVNELTTPNSTVTNDIEINVFVSMGDDFEVAAPDDYFKHFVLKPQSGEILEPQSGVLVPESQNTDEPDAPQQQSSTIIGLPPAESPELNKVFFGEAITSYRTMLKRYELWNTIPKLATVPTVVSSRFAPFPYLRGAVAGAVDTADSGGTPFSYNYVNTLLIHWVRSAFSGHRGSIRYKLVPRGCAHRADRVEVQRAPWFPTAPEYRSQRATMPVYGDQSIARHDIVSRWVAATGNSVPLDTNPLPSYRGLALASNHVNGVLEFEMPYYSSYRFTPGKIEDASDSSFWEAAWDCRIFFQDSGANTNTSTYDVYTAVGEDFQTYFFSGLPRMYYEADPPAP
ncbi:hypothetical protein 2 [Wenzhou picorna-like virus 5]|uniref:hypothetical protein 2 n=1 Tax=Wenzhou picorna-like virus 5 TaxID=1923637 RepID=UPI00090A5281|nr:hypothetical protein 2 [Wenzhou picorna-like virus 5]APG78571.1 hypothetical protein 2 [Wenzhou picorna-like virus 5]